MRGCELRWRRIPCDTPGGDASSCSRMRVIASDEWTGDEPPGPAREARKLLAVERENYKMLGKAGLGRGTLIHERHFPGGSRGVGNGRAGDSLRSPLLAPTAWAAAAETASPSVLGARARTPASSAERPPPQARQPEDNPPLLQANIPPGLRASRYTHRYMRHCLCRLPREQGKPLIAWKRIRIHYEDSRECPTLCSAKPVLTFGDSETKSHASAPRLITDGHLLRESLPARLSGLQAAGTRRPTMGGRNRRRHSQGRTRASRADGVGNCGRAKPAAAPRPRVRCPPASGRRPA